MSEGIFITFEGPEGSGKSTHSARLAEELAAGGYDVLRTAEPGSTALGAKIRDILLEKKEINLCAAAELFLFESDRAQHVKEVIAPALKSGKIVICDRFNTATYAYQGYGLGMDKELISRIDDAATEKLSPSLTLLLDVDVKMGLQRAAAGRSADRMESRDIAFHERVRGGYLDMAKKHPDKIKVVKVIDGADNTYAFVRKEVYGFLERHKRAG